LIAIAVIAIAFLLGSVPWGLIIGRSWHGIDVRRHGSGNLGATNVFRVLGGRAGAVVLALDMGKGAAAVRIAAGPGARAAEASGSHLAPILGVLAALFAVIGHVASPWVRFRGGKGVATAAGAFLALAPPATLIVLAVWAAVFAISRIVSLASITAALALPIVLRLGHAREAIFWLAIPVSLLVLVRHLPNMRRLVSGREHRIHFRRGTEPPPSGGVSSAP